MPGYPSFFYEIAGEKTEQLFIIQNIERA